MNIQIDPEFKKLIPPLTVEEVDQLEKNLLADGCRDPLVIWRGILLDGHHRLEICEKNGIKYKTKQIALPDRSTAMDWIDTNQLGRRNLNPIQISHIRGRIFNRSKKPHGGDRKSIAQNEPLIGTTAERLAKEYGVSRETIKRDGKLAEAIEASPIDIEKAVVAGELPMRTASRILQAPPDKQEGLLEKFKEEGKVTINDVREAKGEDRIPTPSEARKLAKVSGNGVIATDGRVYDGRTKKEVNAEVKINNTRHLLFDSLKKLADLSGLLSPKKCADLIPTHLEIDIEEHLDKAHLFLTEFYQLWRRV